MESEQKQKITACAIICGAPIVDSIWFNDKISKYDFIIAADSGYDHLKNIDKAPNILIGDMDSISEVPENIECVRYPSKKDVTDFSICLEYCMNNNISEVDVYGAWGNRADHSVAAILTMLQYSKKGLSIHLINESSEMFVVSNYCKIMRNNGYISIFSLDDKAYGVTLKNFEYPLQNYDLECCSPLGVSNRIIDEYGEIFLNQGNLLVIIQN